MARVARPVPVKEKVARPSLAARYPDWFALGVVSVAGGWEPLVDQLFADLARRPAQYRDLRQRAGGAGIDQGGDDGVGAHLPELRRARAAQDLPGLDRDPVRALPPTARNHAHRRLTLSDR